MTSVIELPGESVLFVRVKPGTAERASKELREHPSVSRVESVLGPYDLVVTGAFKDLASLRTFAEEVEGKEFCEGCTASPSFEEWARPTSRKGEISAWTLIKAANPERAMKALQGIPAVNRIYTTAGEFNVIANVAADKPHELLETLTQQIQKIREVRRTETLAGIPEEEP